MFILLVFFLTAILTSPFLNAEKLTELEFKEWRQRESLLWEIKQKKFAGATELQFHNLDGSRGKTVSSLIFVLISTG